MQPVREKKTRTTAPSLSHQVPIITQSLCLNKAIYVMDADKQLLL